jgi:ribosome-associated heat shock protein Hsp15
LSDPAAERVRVDKWLWAARFFKTRALASEAIHGGKVHVNGARVKPARTLQPGDTLEIHKGAERFVVVVEALAQRRGSATVARTLYRETDESILARDLQREQERLQAAGLSQPAHRPDKKQRRQLRRLKDI